MFKGVITLILLFLVPAGFLFADDRELKLPNPIERANFSFHLDDTTNLDYCDSVLNQARLDLSKVLGATIGYRPSVYILNDLPRFEKVVEGVFPDWGAAAALPRAQLMAIKSPDHFRLGKPLSLLLRHEFAHLALADRLGIREAPRWLHEGVAMYVSTEWGWSDNLAMSKAAVFDEFIPLNKIEEMNRFNSAKAQLAYAESYWVIRYITGEYDQKTLGIVVDELAKGALIDQALLAAVGSNYKEFDREYQTYLATRFNLLTLYADTMYLWLGLAIVVIIGAFMKFKQRRKYYRKWEQEERLQSTDFDFGDPDSPERIDDEDRPWQS